MPSDNSSKIRNILSAKTNPTEKLKVGVMK